MGGDLTMRRSILFTALALGAQAAWAQEATDGVLPDAGGAAVVEETAAGDAGGAEETVETTDTGSVGDEPGDTEVTDDDTADTEVVVEDTDDLGATEDDADTEVMVEDDDAGATGGDTPDTEVVEDADDGGVEVVDEPRTDQRSPTGVFRGGHHGQVSTLARAGLGRVFGKLRSQGYGDIAISQSDGLILVSGNRRGEVRHLVYDAGTGALVSDVSEPSGGLLEAISGKLGTSTNLGLLV
jgi:hypothetical protein